MPWLLDRLRVSPLYHPLRPFAERVELRRWERSGRPVPVPHPVKREVVRAYARRYRRTLLVETGTYLATMLLEQREAFSRLVSIELEPRLAALARRRCARYPWITVLEGESAALLPGWLAGEREPALFWLDAHGHGPLTAASAPLRAELAAILAGAVDPVVLVDDAHLCGSAPGFPGLHEVEAQAQARGLMSEVRDGILRITPR